MTKPSGAQLGNHNGITGQECRDALHKALILYESKTVKRKQALFQIMTRLVESALDGNLSAIGMITDRLDGKPVQAITGPQGEPITLIERVIINQVTDNSEVDIIQGETVQEKLPEITSRPGGDAIL